MLVSKYWYKIFDREVKLAVCYEIKKLGVWMRVELIEEDVCDDHTDMFSDSPPQKKDFIL